MRTLRFIFLIWTIIDHVVAVTTPIRLVGGNSSNIGRVEIFKNNTWGTICDSLFGHDDADVLCGMLGFKRKGALARIKATYGPGAGPIWLGGLDCTGYETDVESCYSYGLDYYCTHKDDAGVICLLPTTVRLVGGQFSNEGRVEVFQYGAWGTVCDNRFDTKDAAVVCNMLNMTSSRTPPRFYGPGTGRVWLDYVQCYGNETNIDQCEHHDWGNSECWHSTDVGVFCVPEQNCFAATNIPVRLVNGSSTNNGRLEFFYNNTWSTLCDSHFYIDDATVVCRMLGFQT